MAVMVGSLYNALLEAGVSKDGATKAAEELAGHESRFSKLEADVLVLSWMTGFVLASVLGGFGIVIKLLMH